MILTEKIRLVNRSDLSKGSKLLATEIIIASNFRGYCWHSVSALGAAISSSESQVHSYLRELATKGYIRIERRPGTTNRYYLGDEVFGKSEVGVSVSVPKIETKLKTNVNNVIFEPTQKPNVKKDPADRKPFDMSLVMQILELTGDKKSTGCFIHIVRQVPEPIIHAAISSLKIALTEGPVSRPGAYFVQVVKASCPDVFSTENRSVSAEPPVERIVVHAKPVTAPTPTPEPVFVETDEMKARSRQIIEQFKQAKRCFG